MYVFAAVSVVIVSKLTILMKSQHASKIKSIS